METKKERPLKSIVERVKSLITYMMIDVYLVFFVLIILHIINSKYIALSGEILDKLNYILIPTVIALLLRMFLVIQQKWAAQSVVSILSDPLFQLVDSVNKLKQMRLFSDSGVVGIFSNRSSAMQKFIEDIEREDKSISFVGTSLGGTIDPNDESDEKKKFHDSLRKKKDNGVRIRALLMHPAYGEFREKVENREKGAVSRDIQKTMAYLVKANKSSTDALLTVSDIRLYRGVITAYAIIASESMLINMSTLYGPVYDNLTLIIHDTADPNALFKKIRSNHFQTPWASEKTVRFDDESGISQFTNLIKIDFAEDKNRFVEKFSSELLIQSPVQEDNTSQDAHEVSVE